MKLKAAIAKANTIRPNAIDDELKADWIFELERDFADMIGIEEQLNPWPEDCDLLIDYKDMAYVWYVCAMIDLTNEESDMYANDMTTANSMIAEIQARYRRNTRPDQSKTNWKVM